MNTTENTFVENKDVSLTPIELLRKKYKSFYKKDVPVAYKNNEEWISGKIEEATKNIWEYDEIQATVWFQEVKVSLSDKELNREFARIRAFYWITPIQLKDETYLKETVKADELSIIREYTTRVYRPTHITINRITMPDYIRKIVEFYWINNEMLLDDQAIRARIYDWTWKTSWDETKEHQIHQLTQYINFIVE